MINKGKFKKVISLASKGVIKDLCNAALGSSVLSVASQGSSGAWSPGRGHP